MKKKNVALLGAGAMLSLALAGSLGAAKIASAAEITSEGGSTGTTTVKYQIADDWSVTIPETIVIGGAEETKVEVTKAKIEKGKSLKVTVSSGNTWKVKNGSNEFEYELKPEGGSGEALTEGGEVLNVAAGTTDEADLKASLKNADDSKYSTGAQEYTDTLTFTVTVA